MADTTGTSSGWLPPEPPDARGRRESPERPAFAAPVDPPAAGQQERPRFVKAGYRGRRPRGTAMSTASAALGVLGLVLLVLSLGLAAIASLALAGVGWLLATVERRRAQALEPDSPPPARAGRVLGISGVVLSVLALLAWTLVIASGDAPQDVLERWRESLEQQQRELERPDNPDEVRA